jgi:cysteinyl-tRNA synthetase
VNEIVLHDTLTGRLVPLAAPGERGIGIYACGPTVYGRIHVGNARPFVVFSLLKRFLEHEGYDVKLVVNITDVNDKIYDAARAAGRPSSELAAEMTESYRADTDALGLGRPDEEPLASATMDAIVSYIEALIAAGHAYQADGDVYFRVRSDPGYGRLSGRKLESMDQGRGWRAPSSSRTRSTSRCGRRRSPMRTPLGTRRGGRAAPAGTSSARRWPSSSSASASTSTAAGRTSCSPTTRTRPPRRGPPAAGSSPGSGCTTA